MLLFPLMKKRRAVTALIAALRGLTWGTDFTQGADSGLLYSVIDGTTTNAGTGSLAGPTWISAGISVDGNDMIYGLPYSGGAANYIDTTYIFSIHARVYAKASGNLPVWSSCTSDITKGTEFCLASAHSGFLVQNAGGVRIYSWSDGSDNWHTFSLTGDNTNWRVYVDGSLVDTLGRYTCPENPTAGDIIIGYSRSRGYATNGSKYRALAICNVKHSDSEVAAIHTAMAALPNAA
jgi:hypothetical protein